MTHVDQSRPDLSGTSVLIVEDEYYLATDIAQQVRRSGGTVIGPFATFEEGLTSLGEGRPQCALVDINTGDGPSFELADALVAQAVPFAFLTGYDAGSIPGRLSDVQRIEKPASHQKVIDTIVALRHSN